MSYLFCFPYDIVRLIISSWLAWDDFKHLDTAVRASQCDRENFCEFLKQAMIVFPYPRHFPVFHKYTAALSWFESRSSFLTEVSINVECVIPRHFPLASFNRLKYLTLENLSVKEQETVLILLSNDSRVSMKHLEGIALKGCIVSHAQPEIDDWYLAKLLHPIQALKSLHLENIYIERNAAASFAATLQESAPYLRSIYLGNMSDELFVSLFIVCYLPTLQKVCIPSRLHRSIRAENQIYRNQVSTGNLEVQVREAANVRALPFLKHIYAHTQLAHCLSLLAGKSSSDLPHTPAGVTSVQTYISLPSLQNTVNYDGSDNADIDRDSLLRQFLRFSSEICSYAGHMLETLDMNIYYEKQQSIDYIDTTDELQMIDNSSFLSIDYCDESFSFLKHLTNLKSFKLSLFNLPVYSSSWSKSAMEGRIRPLTMPPLTHILASQVFFLDMTYYLPALRSLELIIRDPVFLPATPPSDIDNAASHNAQISYFEGVSSWTQLLVNQCQQLETMIISGFPLNLTILGRLPYLRRLTFGVDYVESQAWNKYTVEIFEESNSSSNNVLFPSLRYFGWNYRRLCRRKRICEHCCQFILRNARHLRQFYIGSNLCILNSIKYLYLRRYSSLSAFDADGEDIKEYIEFLSIDLLRQWLEVGDKIALRRLFLMDIQNS